MSGNGLVTYSHNNGAGGVWRAVVVQPCSDGKAYVYIPALHKSNNPFKVEKTQILDENGEPKIGPDGKPLCQYTSTTELKPEIAEKIEDLEAENETQLEVTTTTTVEVEKNVLERIGDAVFKGDTSATKTVEKTTTETVYTGAESSAYTEVMKFYPKASICSWQVRTALNVGDAVYIMFENGNINYPVIVGQLGTTLPLGTIGGTGLSGGEYASGGGSTSGLGGDEGYIWNYFSQKLGNDYGVAGLMGNLAAESGLHPDRLQGDIPYSNRSVEYTANVDSGTVSEYDFVRKGPGGGGYGLAQWTYYTRKQNMYNKWKSGGYSSIGCIQLACDFLWDELNSYGLVGALSNAKSIQEASNVILLQFEKPADQGPSVQALRANMGQDIYNRNIGGGSTPSNTPPSGGTSSAAQAALNFMRNIAANNTHGYSQANRWGNPDYDCSSLVITAYEQAGVPVKSSGASYTGNMISIFKSCGFVDVTSQVTFSNCSGLLPGDVLWRSGHTAMYVGSGTIVHARGASLGSTSAGDQGSEISESSCGTNWSTVLRYSG